MMQNNDFRSATNLRSLGRSRLDNTFATAKNLGSILPNATSVSFRASGTVGKSDNVDLYKFTVPPGVNLPSGSNNYSLRGGSALLSSYGEVSGTKELASKFRLQRGSTSVTSSLVNPTQFPITVYLKLESRIRETRYNLTFDFFQ
jgi:hypothetical protein